MSNTQEVYDVVIIGAGPAGLACAIAAKRHKLRYAVIEKGCLVNSLYRFPTNVVLFSTPNLLEIGGVPFIISTEKPTRNDLLNYYRRVTESFALNVRVYERVDSISNIRGGFGIKTALQKYTSKHVVVATGQFDNPNLLCIPGETLAKVNHYYTEGHPYSGKKVAVIGGKNSAVEVALDLYRHGAEVALVHHGDRFGASVKYWILPDIQNRIKESSIEAYFNTAVTEIKEKAIVVRNGDGEEREIANDFLFAMTGYRPDDDFLRNTGIDFDPHGAPIHDAKTLETNVPGLYIAGVLTAGTEGSKVFIENSRKHGNTIIGHIVNG